MPAVFDPGSQRRARRPGAVLGSLRQRCLVGQAMALVLWNAPAFAQNVITPDGRTQTNVAVSGATTTITTQTVSGGAGYNSFSRFEQSAGTTVNMHLPQNTGALVNIVRNGPVVVNGILNSYKNGNIGGHIYFSDSAGFTVGPSGVINTGRLTVNTPTREFLDQVIAPNGTINETLAARLRANDVPISPDGAISIEGRINAKRGVTLHGNSVSVAGQITANAAPVDIGEQRRRHQTAFSQSVNTSGLRHGGAMVARRGGGIEIVAAGTARISGSLSANATARRSAGTIMVRSGKGTTITETAKLSATGAAPSAKLASAATGSAAVNTGDGGKISVTSDAGIAIARGARFDVSAAQTVAGKGGEIKVFAGTNLDVESGAFFAGKGGLTGDGGFLELSAKKTVTIDAIDVDLATRNGKNGVFLIDPQDLVISSANISVNGADVNLTADNSITIAAGGSVDTRRFNRANGDLSATNASTGSSGAITLTAPKITVLGQLRADVVNAGGTSWQAGDITLTSTASTTQNSGNARAEAIILVNGMVSGKDVKFIADATGISSFINPSANMAQFIGLTAQALLTGLNGGYVASTIESRVTIQGNATVKATGGLTVTADGKQETSLPAITLTGISPLAAAITLAEIKGTITTEIESGASVDVGGNLTLASYNNATMAATAIAVSGGQTRFDAAIAVGTADITTKAIVNSGASVTVGTGSVVKISAINQNSFSTGATAVAASGGVAGIAFAYSDVKSSAEARLGTSIGSSTSRAGNLLIESQNNTIKNATSSSVTVGTNFILDKLGIAGAIDGLFGSLTSGGSALGKFGSSFTYAQSDLSANASIAANPGTTTAPTIYAGDVAVVSKVYDFAVRINADSSLNSESKNPTAANPSATIAVSAGVLYGDFKHTSNASIGAGVTVDASHIGVGATTDMPISNTWTNWAGLGETLSHINGSFGIVSNILTSYANATSDSTELGLAGSVNYYRVGNNTAAYVGPGATLRQSGSLGDWTTGFTTGDSRTWSNGVTVVADTTTHSIDMAGNSGLFSLTGTSGGGGSAVGGSLADVGRSSTTVAAIGEGVTISADDLLVKAATSDKMFVIAPTSGKAAGAVAANGIVSLVGIDNHTYASISNTAIITASSVKVTADQYLSVFSLTGAVAYSGSNGIGVSVAVLDPATVTRAYVGDNSDDLSNGRLGSGYARGSIATGTIDVEATTWGRLTAASIAAAISDPNASKLNFAKGIAAAVQGENAAQAAAGKGFSLSAAGSAAVATTTLGTSAWIDGAVLTQQVGAGVTPNVSEGLTPTVTALNSTIMEVAAGSAALNLAGNSSPLSGALAGAVAIGMFDNSTDARISNSTLTDAYESKVLAISGGRATVVGVSIAAARPNSGAAAVSAAIGIVTNRVSASVIDSTIRAAESMTVQKSFWVGAYQTTDIGIGGGAAYAGAQAGLSAALSYTSITDPTGQDAVSAIVSGSDIRNYNDPFRVTAQNSSRISSGAASGGAGADSTGFAGAFVINEIDPTTRAQILRGSGAIPEIRLTDDLVVLADGSRNSDLDAIIAGRTAASDIGQIDFSGSVTNDAGASNPVGASIVAVAGAVQVGKNNAGVSLLKNRIAQSHIATIDGVNVTTNGLITVKAQDNSTITGVAVGLGVASGQFAGVASTVFQSIDNVVTARISGVGGRVGGGGIVIDASATSTIRGSAGSLGIGIGAAALGLSIVDSDIANQVSAQVEDVRLRAENDILVKAGSQATISTVAVGVAISRNVGLAGSIANNTIATDVAATIKRADVLALDDVGLIATNSDAITVSAGALGVTVLAPSVAGGLSVVNNTIGGSTTAAISETSSVDAYATTANSGLSYNAGRLAGNFDLTTANGPSAAQPSLAMTARSNHGLSVVATSQQRILANAVTGGVAIFPASAAVAIVPIRNALGGTTTASIDGSLIDTRLNGADASNIAVNAASHSYAATFITVGSVGGAAAAGADAKTVMNRTTQAKLTNSTTGTTTPGFTGAGVGFVDVSAAASQSASGTVVGFAVGIGGGAAAGVVNSFDAVTTASIDQGLVTAGSVSVSADSRNGFYARAAVGVGGAVALGGAFVVANSANTTLATIGGGAGVTSFRLNGGLGILANSDNDFTGLAAGGVAGGGVGIAGMVVFIDVENETRAGLYGANVVHRTGAGVTAGVSVTATETSTITPKAGAGAASGGFGLGSSTNIASLDSRVLAEVSGLVLSSTGALSVQATSKRVVDAMTTTIGIGSSAGLGASVGVISVGTSAPTEAQNEINSGGNGTLSRVNQLTSGSTDLVLSTSGLSAYRSYRGAAANSLTETELRDAAETEFNTLLGNGTVTNGAYSLSSAGVTALRATAATALGVTNPTDTQVQNYASGRYTALNGGRVGYLLSDGGVNAYRSQAVTTDVPTPTDDQVRSAADAAYQALIGRGNVTGGVFVLGVSYLDTYRAAAFAAIPLVSRGSATTASDQQVRDYAANQYSFFTGHRSRITTPQAVSATALLDSPNSQTGASITGGTIASGSVSVTSLSTTSTTNMATGLGVGGVGVGAATAYTTIGDAVSAKLDQATVTTGSITVSATSADGTDSQGAAKSAAYIKSSAGAGSGAAAAGAAVADGSVTNTITAKLGGTLTVTGASSVSASNTATSRSDAVGAAAAGGLALGVSLAKSAADSSVTANYAAGSQLTGGSLAVAATSTGAAYASAIAGAGGILVAGAGSDARASDTSRVEASIGAGARANVGTGAINVTATASPDAKASSLGVAVAGGLGVGAAKAQANAAPTVLAAIYGNASLPTSQFTAGSLIVSATGSIFGTAATDISGRPDLTGNFTRGGSSSAAWATAGSGSIYYSAIGTDSRAATTASVTASVGNYVRLPNGTVSITASNTTVQRARGIGITAGGVAAVGTVNAQADATTTTLATVGDSVLMAGNSSGSFTLKATGSDTGIARVVSGSGGTFAGSGATASTSDNATTQATIGSSVSIGTNQITIAAKHSDIYGMTIDSGQAAAVGASASIAKHDADSDVLVQIGANAVFVAIGNGTARCYVTTCVQGIGIEARNVFTQASLGDTITAGAGGGVNGVGAKSTIDIDGTAKVLIGDTASFTSGSNAVSAPGPISIQAITELSADDVVTLTTGGLIQGAGVTSQYRANVDNEVTLGASNSLTSSGTINVGTYTTAMVKTSALVTTYGVAAVGTAEADTDVITHQTITIGTNSTLVGLDNVNVTAGRDASGIATTAIFGDATAIGYVRGLIAIPDADASTDLQNHARLVINTGAALLSAQNVTLGAYNGTVTPNADGAGHGFQLFLIPVTQRDESPGSLATSTVVMNGRAVGGVFREQDIIIGCGTGGLSICGLNERPTVYVKAGGAPVTVTFNEFFNATQYVRDNYTTYTGTLPDTAVADTLVGGIAPGAVWAYRISQLYAAGGNVYVNGDTIQGNGSLTANGGPTISVKNNSAAYLILDGGAYIPDLSTGDILFTGAAQGRSGLTQNAVNANGTASIIINNAYTRDDIGGYGPALLIGDDVTNLGGLVSINNTQGSFGFSGNRIDALQFNVTVPNGAVAVASNGANGLYNAGAAPEAEWGNAITYPGATPGQSSQSFSIVDTVNAIANTLYFGSYSNLNYNLYHRIEDGGNPGQRVSTIFYGNCIGYGSTGYNCGANGYTYQGTTFNRYAFGNGIDFVTIPQVPTYRESNSAQAQGGGVKIYGAQVAIKATTININASIEAGRVTNQSVYLDQNLYQSIAFATFNYNYYGYGSPTIDLTNDARIQNYGTAANTYRVVNSGDKLIPVTYDIRTNQLTISDVNASSGGGSVLLDGQIISTNALGRIKINGGFGKVDIVNNSGIELITNRVNTGTAAGANAAVSKITIVDRLKPTASNTTVYAYTPGSGIAEYRTSNGAQPILSGANATTPVRFIAGTETSYDVKDGTRYEWTQQLMVYKDGLVSGNPNAQGTWRYSSGTANNPWVYVAGPATGLWGDGNSSGPDWWNQTTSPQGRVTHNEYYYISNPVFYQTLQGGVSQVSNAQQTYGNCNGQAISHCDRDFVGNSGSTANTYWNYNHVFDAWLQVTASVRADYDFGISFAGNAAGSVGITSNAAIRQQGNIVNPSGETKISANAGSFTQAPNVSILSNHLTIVGRDSVGSADAPIRATLTAGAAIAAYSGAGGIYLNLDSDAKIWRLNADLDAGSGRYGDINLRATGGLEVASWADPNYTHALGNNISIKSDTGAVGSTTTPLRIQAMATTLANGSQTGGVVNIAAQGDIGIRQLSGNLRVGQIASTGGNVRVDVVSGTLKSASAQTAAQSLSAEQLSTISTKLKLTQADGADAAAQASVTAFERNVNDTYVLYTSLIRNGTVTNGVFRLSDAAIPLYQALANAAYGGTASADQVRAYAADRYANYANVFNSAYGAGWSTQSRFQTASLENGYSFSVGAANAAPGLAASATVRQLGVTTFERNVTDTYSLYSALIVNGSVTNGVFTLNQSAIASFQPAANAALGRTASETEVLAYAADRYTTYAGVFSSAYGTGWSSQARFQAGSLQTNYSFSVTAQDATPGLATSNTIAQLGVTTFERNVNDTYSLYNALIRSGTVANGAFTLNQGATSLYQAAADAALGRTATQAEVQTYAAGRYTSYTAVFSSAYGSNWSSQVGTRFDTDGADARPGLTSSITANSVWQTGQLVAAIDQAALQPASGVVGNGTAIVVGRDVTLNIGGSIGSLAPDVSVSLDAIRNGTLSTAELQALAVATTPGSVKLVGTNGSGQRVNVASLGSVPNGVTLTSVDIAQTAPLFISATGRFSASAQGDIYVQATTGAQAGGGSLNLGRVTATGAVNLQAPQAITVATASGSTTPLNAVQIETGGDLTLSAAGGSIGSAATPLTYQIGGRLVSASAGAGDAYLVKPTGDAQIGRIFAQGTASIRANAGSITSYLPGVAVSAQSVQLNASANVGSQATPFAVQSADDGEISGQIGGSGWISTPTLPTQTAVAMRIGALTAANSLSLAADAELRVLRSLAANTGTIGATAGSITMAAGATVTAAGRITLGSATDLVVGSISSTLVAPQGTASIALSAAGAITGNGDAIVNLAATQAGGVISLNAGNGIGTTALAVSYDAPTLSARSLLGGVNLRAASASRITSVVADAGAVGVTSAAALTIDTLTAGTTASAISTAATLTIGTLSAGGTATLTADQALAVTSATTTSGNLVLTSTQAGIGATTLHAAAQAQLTAAGAIGVTTLTSGSATSVSSTNGALNLTSATSGTGATFAGRNGVTLGSASTQGGALVATSSAGAISAGTLASSGGATLTAATNVSVTTSLIAGGAASATTTGGTLGITTLRAGATSTLSASGTVTLGGATTTAGDLSVTSTGAGITATTIETAGAATLAAAGPVSVTTSLISGGATTATTTAGTLGITTLHAGATSTLSASGAVTLGSATTTAGDLSVTSTGAGITATTIETAGAASLTAAGPISVLTSLISGGATTATTTASTLGITTLHAGATSTLSASGAVTLGGATTTAGALSVTSTGAGITATTIETAGAATLTAAGAISVTTSLISGGATTATTTGGTLGITTLRAGATSTLSASGAVTLGGATTTAGALYVTSTGAGITAATIDTAGATTLTAAGAISVTTSLTSGGATTATTTGGTLGITTLRAGASSTLSASGAVTLGDATTTAGDLSVTSTGAGISAATIATAGAATLTAATSVSVTTSLISGGAVSVTATSGGISIVGLSGGGSLTLSSFGALVLGAVATSAGDISLTSTGGSVSATSIDAPGWVSLTAATSVSVTTSSTSGGATTATAHGGALDIGTMNAGATSALWATGPITLTNAATTAGDLSIVSTGSLINAAFVESAGAVTLAANLGISVTSAVNSGGATTATSGGTLRINGLGAGATSALSASGAIELSSAAITGDLSVTSTGADISANAIVTTGAATFTAAGSITLATLTTGVDATLTSGGLQTLGTATVTGDLTAASGAGLSGLTLATTGSARLNAVGDVDINRLQTGRDLIARVSAGGFDLRDGTSGGKAEISAAGSVRLTTLAGAGAVTIASSNAGVTLTMLSAGEAVELSAATGINAYSVDAGAALALRTGGGIDAQLLSSGGNAIIEAAGALQVTSLTSGGRAQLTGDTIGVRTLTAAQAASVSGRGAITILGALTRSGSISIVSQSGPVRADSIDGAGAVMVQAPGEVTLGSVKSGTDVTLASFLSTLGIGTLTNGRDGSLAGARGLDVQQASSGRDLTLVSAGGDVRIGGVRTGRDLGAQAQTIRFIEIDAGRSATLTSDSAIAGERIVATDTLSLQAGRSGLGSIAIDLGAARSTLAQAPDDVRLGRFGAGDRITILGTSIAADIVQLGGGSGVPLALDIGGLRERTATTTRLAIDAPSFRIGRFETVDGTVTTTSNLFRITDAFVPGALTLTTPIMTVFANNRSIAPVTGYDVQLYQRDRSFFIDVAGRQLVTNAFIVGFDSDIVDSSGGSLSRDMERLGVVLPTGLSFGEIARGFVLGSDGRWRSADPETTASIGGRGNAEPLVNLDGAEGQP
jgi:hypothetical protein